MWMGRNAGSNNYYFSTDYGNTFTLGNTTPESNYIGMGNDCIACNNDGSIVVSGSINSYYINSCRENTSEVRVISTLGNSGINITDNGNGAYSISSSVISGSTYFADISLSSPNTNYSFPSNMDLFKYDYELDFTINEVIGNNWFYLRFNQDSGIISWASNLFFNPDAVPPSLVAPVVGLYNNNSVGSNIYWLNGGRYINGNMTLKVTYRISAIDYQRFVVSLMQSQPVNMAYGDNINGVYMVFAPQIVYRYNSNNPSRWCPTHFNIVGTGGSFTGGRCLIRQVVKSSSYL